MKVVSVADDSVRDIVHGVVCCASPRLKCLFIILSLLVSLEPLKSLGVFVVMSLFKYFSSYQIPRNRLIKKGRVLRVLLLAVGKKK